jgi:hypothetical protein
LLFDETNRLPAIKESSLLFLMNVISNRKFRFCFAIAE